MLVLTRRIGEEIFIQRGKIKIKVLYIRRGQVAIGIRAPSEVEIDREEIFHKKQADALAETSPVNAIKPDRS
jgi:carbon storage regulator